MELTQSQQKSLERFQAIVRKKTVSDRNGNIDREEFASFLPMLKEIYPDVFSVVESQLINEFGILLRWKGKNSALAPVVLMAHYDVVSDKDQNWEHPAFEAEIHDGVVWGRGTIDNKCIFTGVLEGMEKLIHEGHIPERDIYFAAGNNEEVAGDTMIKIADWFIENNIKPWFVLDEGGAIMTELPMGITHPFAMVAVSEKGWATVKVTLKGETIAHAAKSTGKVPVPVKMLRAMAKLDSTPMPAQFTPPVEGMLKAFAPYASKPLNIVMDKVSILKPAIKKVMEGIEDAAAMIRTTINLIGIDVPNKGNLPADTAVATYRLRIAPHDTLEAVLDHIKKVVGDEFEVTAENVSLPAPISDHKTKSFEYIKSTINRVFPDVGVAPFILNAATDARHFRNVCKEVYRFGGFRIDDELFKSVHNANERLPVDVFLKSIDFYVEFMKNLK